MILLNSPNNRKHSVWCFLLLPVVIACFVRKMLEELKSMDLINKVGGRFKLSALIQKRMLEIMQGARPLIEDVEGKTTMEIVVQEIKEDKITADFNAPPEKIDLPTL